MGTWLLLFCLVLPGLGGCVSLEERVEALETRGVQSCRYAIAFPWPFAVLRTITATGGATIEQCRAIQ